MTRSRSVGFGARLLEAGPGKAAIGLDVQDQHKQQHGYVHGGVVSYLADNAITFAGGLALGGNALTSEFKINYLRPARGDTLVARATTKSAGRRQAVCVCEVYGLSGTEEELCAVALGTVVGSAPQT